jgi:hypothetical protein
MSEIKHTPTPWGRSTQQTSKGEYILWTEASDKGSYRYIGYINDKDDADFINQAVNSYDSRTALIKELKEALEDMKKWYYDLANGVVSGVNYECIEKVDSALSSVNKIQL